ncbi:hypothetical protein [Gilliamella sp. GillExp13]|uniref:hypothetical protein n=1 Tax=Gilliamella sp. GillExp13 TaxID=3120243 RepID=UPI00080EB202|nr:hypothetical protein A9G37_10580 [Gilliamella apicola]
MGLAIGGIIANWLAVLSFYLLEGDEISKIILPFSLIFVCIATLGLVATIINKNLGGVLIIIGSIFFIPLGLISIFGGRNIIDQRNKELLNERRNLLK